MQSLKVFAWLSFGAAALCLLAAIVTGFEGYLLPAVSGGVAGVLFLALDRIVSLMTEIRDALVIREPEPTVETAAAVPTRTLAEVDADIKRLARR